MKKLGNEIPWYKPMKLIKRNKDLETLNNAQYVSIKALEEENDELKEKIKNRDKYIEEITKSNINILNNTAIIRTTLLNIKEMCKASKTKLAKEILEQIKID